MVLISSESCGNFLIDKYEVTNEQYKEFVDKGGYERQEYWRHPFVKDGQEVSREEGMGEFRDKTGRPGPADWEGGTYPKGQEKYPVSGISWFEAAAYAEYAGKSLPTVSHWYEAANTEQASLITPYSNFKGKPASVGRYQGIGRNGLYDMAGNVREWCWNTVEGSPEQKCILGGSCADPEYMFIIRDTLTVWDRSERNGFRCVSYAGGREPPAGSVFEPVEERISRDARQVSPLSQEEFASCLGLYSYDQAEIAAEVEHVNDGSASWEKQRITFDAPYGKERVAAYLFLPNGIAPPYQPVVYCPSANALVGSQSGDLRDMGPVRLLVESGRAVLYPIYKGTYDRNFEDGRPDALKQPIAYRNWCVQMYQDLARSIDYLESRDDIDMNKLTYFGTSWGAANGPLFIALEKRIRNAILVGAGCFHKSFPPFADPIRFAPHVKVPATMFNGTNDTFFPYETSQKPLFDLLGPDSKHKTHRLYPGGHVITGSSAKQLQRDILECLDGYLGSVDAK